MLFAGRRRVHRPRELLVANFVPNPREQYTGWRLRGPFEASAPRGIALVLWGLAQPRGFEVTARARLSSLIAGNPPLFPGRCLPGLDSLALALSVGLWHFCQCTRRSLRRPVEQRAREIRRAQERAA